MQKSPATPEMTAPPEWSRHSPDMRTLLSGKDRGPLKRAALRRVATGIGVEARYQPLVHMQTHRPIAMEALVRLQLSTEDLLYPGDFLPQIEAAGLAGALTDAMARLAFSDWAALTDTVHRPVLSINFSLDVLLSAPALARLDARRQAANIPSSVVLIELTESRPVEDLVGLERSLRRVREAGYAVALDDITPSLPHLDRLLEMPFTVLKLDKGVVRGAAEHTDAAAFISRILATANAQGMAVTAEGVEDARIWAKMSALGVHAAQGYLIGAPMRAADILDWLADWTARYPLQSSLTPAAD